MRSQGKVQSRDPRVRQRRTADARGFYGCGTDVQAEVHRTAVRQRGPVPADQPPVGTESAGQQRHTSERDDGRRRTTTDAVQHGHVFVIAA